MSGACGVNGALAVGVIGLLMFFGGYPACAAEGAEETVALEPLELPDDFYPISTWDPVRGWEGQAPLEEALEGIAACNFTIAGFATPEELPACERFGLKAIVRSEADKGRIKREEWKTLSPEEIDARIKQVVDACGDSPAVLGYYLQDEPGATLFPGLAHGVAAVKKYAPGKLAYINLFPGYATIGAPDTSQLETPSFTEYLEQFVKIVRPQILSYDDYMVQYSMDFAGAPERRQRYFLDLCEVRRVAKKYGLPFWNIVSANQIRPFTTVPSPANMALQAYTTLAAGGRGLSWFTYYVRGYDYAPINKAGNRTATWQYLQFVNRQVKTLGPYMNRLESKGVYFTEPAPAEGLDVLPGKLVTSVAADAPVMVGEFESADGTPYIMLVNLSLSGSVKLVVSLADGLNAAAQISPEDTSENPVDVEENLWLPSGQGILIKLARS